MPNRPLPTRRDVLTTTLVAVMAISAGACRSDGRDLRDPTAPLPVPTTTTLAPAATTTPFNPVTTPPQVLTLLAPWQDGASVPARHTCDDIDVSPALTWTNLPEGTVEVALTMNDLDADLVHWVVTGIDLDVTGTIEGQAPDGATVWPNDLGSVGWTGPCPPPDDSGHLYLFTVHALNQQLEVADDASAAEVVELLNQTALAQSSVSGTYTRAG
jgi:Raf kinase inhibitor-like YbhB/YbcL family protein